LRREKNSHTTGGPITRCNCTRSRRVIKNDEPAYCESPPRYSRLQRTVRFPRSRALGAKFEKHLRLRWPPFRKRYFCEAVGSLKVLPGFDTQPAPPPKNHAARGPDFSRFSAGTASADRPVGKRGLRAPVRPPGPPWPGRSGNQMVRSRPGRGRRIDPSPTPFDLPKVMGSSRHLVFLPFLPITNGASSACAAGQTRPACPGGRRPQRARRLRGAPSRGTDGGTRSRRGPCPGPVGRGAGCARPGIAGRRRGSGRPDAERSRRGSSLRSPRGRRP